MGKPSLYTSTKQLFYACSCIYESCVARPFIRSGRCRLEMISAHAKRVWNSSQYGYQRCGDGYNRINYCGVLVIELWCCQLALMSIVTQFGLWIVSQQTPQLNHQNATTQSTPIITTLALWTVSQPICTYAYHL